MSRQKSNRTLLIEQERAARKEERDRKRAEKERDKAIRTERRERKQAEREAKREERLKKRLTHESVERNGVPKVKEGAQYFGLRDAIAVNELTWCESCDRVVREREMIGDVCAECYYGKEVMESENLNGLKAEENRAVPGKGDGRVNGTAGFAGQLLLLI